MLICSLEVESKLLVDLKKTVLFHCLLARVELKFHEPFIRILNWVLSYF